MHIKRILLAPLLVLASISPIMPSANAGGSCDIQKQVLAETMLKGLSSTYAQQAFDNCIRSGGTVGSSPSSSSEPGLWPETVKFPCVEAAQERRKNISFFSWHYPTAMEQARAYCDKIKSAATSSSAPSPSGGCKYNGRSYATCAEANAQYQKDLEIYNQSAAKAAAEKSAQQKADEQTKKCSFLDPNFVRELEGDHEKAISGINEIILLYPLLADQGKVITTQYNTALNILKQNVCVTGSISNIEKLWSIASDNLVNEYMVKFKDIEPLLDDFLKKADNLPKQQIDVTKIATPKGSKKSLDCVKRNTYKKISGTNPKCPKGFKILK